MILRWLWHLSYFYVTWGTFFAVAVITFVVLCIHNRTVFSLRRFIRHCVPFEAWTSKSVRMDVFLWGLAKVMTFRDLPLIGSSMAVAALLSRHLKQLFPNLTTIRPTAWMLAVAIACLLVFKEFVDYAIHYAQHRVPILWELHKVHHTALHLMPLTAKRGHPLEMFMQGAIVGVANGLAFGVCGFIFGLSLPELILSTGILGKMMTIGSIFRWVSAGWIRCLSARICTTSITAGLPIIGTGISELIFPFSTGFSVRLTDRARMRRLRTG
jgi:sterol desaturase/sphingolipid hydroxylase (fatty acid hydroxylase superfamily)